MRPTNDERREVAKRLRYVADHRVPELATIDYCIVKCIGGVDSTLWDWSCSLFSRLADLIEPEERTCRIYDTDHDFEDSLRCDACQTTFRRPWQPFNFCPYCGAKVVDK